MIRRTKPVVIGIGISVHPPYDRVGSPENTIKFDDSEVRACSSYRVASLPKPRKNDLPKRLQPRKTKDVLGAAASSLPVNVRTRLVEDPEGSRRGWWWWPWGGGQGRSGRLGAAARVPGEEKGGPRGGVWRTLKGWDLRRVWGATWKEVGCED